MAVILTPFLPGIGATTRTGLLTTPMRDRFGLTAADARARDNYALRMACAEGYLEVAQWLADRFGPTARATR